ncbi:hypothetical protein IIC38_18775 [candidate division KSB1 bacterium]|nr:hypothetical protein [candidate division KSB1 bacterium]
MNKMILIFIILMLFFCSISYCQNKVKNPCESSAKHRQLDFWVGEWDVYNQKNKKVGTNSIKKIQGGCAIQENWTGSSGSTGTSLNLYEPASGKWEQLWVAASGYIIWYRGEFKDGAMRLTEGENILMDGSKEKSRMTLTPTTEGNVIQLIEQSKDDGETWYVWFKGTYVPATNN